MARTTVIIFLPIPVTSIHGIVSQEGGRAFICRVRLKNPLRFLVTEVQSHRPIHVSSRNQH